MIASSEFVHAAKTQAAALGMPEMAEASIFVPHPVQGSTDEEMHEKARAAYHSIVSAITG